MALFIPCLGTRKGWVVKATLRPLYPRLRALVLSVQEVVWASAPVWMGAENLAPQVNCEVCLLRKLLNILRYYFLIPNPRHFDGENCKRDQNHINEEVKGRPNFGLLLKNLLSSRLSANLSHLFYDYGVKPSHAKE